MADVSLSELIQLDPLMLLIVWLYLRETRDIRRKKDNCDKD
jgi:hypothetical protein